MIEISWRNYHDAPDEYPNKRVFTDKLYDGKTPREFIVWVIRHTPAVSVAFNNRVVWSTDLGHTTGDAEMAALHAIMGEPRQAQSAEQFVVVDYTTDGDWIDNECKKCGGLQGTHVGECVSINSVD